MLISIVTVAFNVSQTIEETIQSVRNQTYKKIEYIIIDGGSTDGTINIIQKYNEDIHYWVSESDKGIYHAMNKGIQIATGDFITFLNGGDSYSSTTSVQDIVSSIDNTNQVYFGNAMISSASISWLVPPEKSKDRVGKWLEINHPCHQTVFYPKAFYGSNTYSESLGFAADTDYTLRSYKTYSFKHVDVSVAKFLLGGTSNELITFNQSYTNFQDQKKLHRLHRIRYPMTKDMLFFFKHWIKFMLFKIGGSDLQYFGMYFHKLLAWKIFYMK